MCTRQFHPQSSQSCTIFACFYLSNPQACAITRPDRRRQRIKGSAPNPGSNELASMRLPIRNGSPHPNSVGASQDNPKKTKQKLC